MPLTLAILVTLALGLALAFRRAFEPPRVEVGDRGIRDHGLGLGWIRWDEIEGAYPPSVADGDSLRLKVRLSRRLRRVLRRRELTRSGVRRIGQSLLLPLHLEGSEVQAVELLQEILSHRSSR